MSSTPAASTTPSQVYTRGSAAIALFDAGNGSGLLAFGGAPGMPAGYIDIESDGQGIEYRPFDGTTHRVAVSAASGSPFVPA
ncbi:hypothetical protein [Cupriavidus pauculus]|uniref:Uncharacterized protein n=1 Tax=Cupriavidus pauculus TaxID=82633 RepID=A0A2N5C5I4_9BURK|nr:hypothetical protein [Cupriavidus pauculus]PLP97489.1 hypothetical protein CYJ10_27050 [Cupriavidus pauculus]